MVLYTWIAQVKPHVHPRPRSRYRTHTHPTSTMIAGRWPQLGMARARDARTPPGNACVSSSTDMPCFTRGCKCVCERIRLHPRHRTWARRCMCDCVACGYVGSSHLHTRSHTLAHKHDRTLIHMLALVAALASRAASPRDAQLTTRRRSHGPGRDGRKYRRHPSCQHDAPECCNILATMRCHGQIHSLSSDSSLWLPHAAIRHACCRSDFPCDPKAHAPIEAILSASRSHLSLSHLHKTDPPRGGRRVGRTHQTSPDGTASRR